MKTKTTKYSMDKFIQELEEDRRKHPIRIFFKDIYYKIVNCLEDIKRIPLKIKWFIQRGKRGWADCDTWNLSSYLSEVTENSIIHLKKHHLGFPQGLTNKKWEKILKNISYAFYLSNKITNFELLLIRNEKTKNKFKKENKKYGFKHRCMTKREIQKYDEGWRLFKKYFFNLWD